MLHQVRDEKREKLKFTMRRKSCSYTRPLPLCAHRNDKLNMRSLRTSACWCSFPIQSSESLRIISSSPTHGLLCYRIEAQCLTCHLITQSRPEVIRSRGKMWSNVSMEPRIADKRVCLSFDLKRRWFSTHRKAFLSSQRKRSVEKITERDRNG